MCDRVSVGTVGFYLFGLDGVGKRQVEALGLAQVGTRPIASNPRPTL
jgi:hypothetical protein